MEVQNGPIYHDPHYRDYLKCGPKFLETAIFHSLQDDFKWLLGTQVVCGLKECRLPGLLHQMKLPESRISLLIWYISHIWSLRLSSRLELLGV